MIELLFHTRRLSTSTRVSRVSRTGVLNPSRVHLVYGSTGARGHVGVVFNHHGPHFFAHYCTLTRALTFSDTSGVRACLVREDWRIERVAVAAQTLAVSVLVRGASTRARIRRRGWTLRVAVPIIRPPRGNGSGACVGVAVVNRILVV